MNIDLSNEQPEPGLEPFVTEFLNDREEELPQLENSIEQKDFNSIRQLAHRWKGFCAPYGFEGLGALSLELENAADDKDSAACMNLYKEMNDYLHAKRRQIMSNR